MTTFERWDIVVAPFPFTDAAVRKSRPILVLSSADFNREHGHFIGCMITTAAHGDWPSDHRLGDLGPTGLTHSSVVRWKVFTLTLGLVARRIGALGPHDRGAVAMRMAQVLIA